MPGEKEKKEKLEAPKEKPKVPKEKLEAPKEKPKVPKEKLEAPKELKGKTTAMKKLDKIKSKQEAKLQKIKKEKEKKEAKNKQETLKKESFEKRKALFDKKKQKIIQQKQQKKYKKLLSLPEPKQQVIRAAGGGLLGVLALVAFTYILWGIATDESIIYAGFMFDMLSMGNPFNAMAGVWAMAFTPPFSSLGVLYENWSINWYYTYIPIIIAGVVIGTTTRRLLTTIFGVLFFIFWGIVLPILFVYIFSLFGIFDPAIIDGILIAILEEPIDEWSYDVLLVLTNNIFLSWSIAGSLELGLLMFVFAVPVGALIQAIK